MVYNKGTRSAVAVEPNKDMFAKGKYENQGASINWIRGSAEQLDSPDSSKDWVTMASSFHWTNYETAIKEFARILRRGGHFTALWNPRLIEINPLLVELESYLQTLSPNIKRVSSGLSDITETLTEQLCASSLFEDIIYMQGRHAITMTPERYLTAWKSVNDIRFQLGSEKWMIY
jgi:ubiquinone/menaquinone biosynthesis C-methylase UbiE